MHDWSTKNLVASYWGTISWLCICLLSYKPPLSPYQGRWGIYWFHHRFCPSVDGKIGFPMINSVIAFRHKVMMLQTCVALLLLLVLESKSQRSRSNLYVDIQLRIECFLSARELNSGTTALLWSHVVCCLTVVNISHFWLLKTRLMIFEETWQEASTQCLLWSLCRSEEKGWKMATLASEWLSHFHFSFATAEQNLMKLYRKQELNVLFQICIFLASWKAKMTVLASDCLRHLQLLHQYYFNNGVKWYSYAHCYY